MTDSENKSTRGGASTRAIAANTDVLKTLRALWQRGSGSPTLTLLAGGTSPSSWLSTGNISLRYPLSNYDGFFVVSCSDDNNYFSVRYYPYDAWSRGLSIAKNGSTSKPCYLLAESGAEGWWVNPMSTTSSSLVCGDENSKICAIYGVNF